MLEETKNKIDQVQSELENMTSQEQTQVLAFIYGVRAGSVIKELDNKEKT